MERLVSVSAFEFSTKWPSSHYVRCKYSDFNIKCTIVTEDRGLLWDRYTLKLEGSTNDIQMFLDYLKYEGFKIK